MAEELRYLTQYAQFEEHLPFKFCKDIIEEYSKQEYERLSPQIGADSKHTIDKNIRDVQRVEIPTNNGVGGVLTATALNANNYWWQYNITHSNQAEFLMYGKGGRYTQHIDLFHAHTNESRKLTALAFLNDNYEGGKFFLYVNGDLHYPPQKAGTVLVFPST
jgi:predicted 2-oxoglutarate/Fe(II)-dependent dioxygenase YbiX